MAEPGRIKTDEAYQAVRRELLVYQRRAGDVLGLVGNAVTQDDWDFVIHMASELMSAATRVSGLALRLHNAAVS